MSDEKSKFASCPGCGHIPLCIQQTGKSKISAHWFKPWVKTYYIQGVCTSCNLKIWQQIPEETKEDTIVEALNRIDERISKIEFFLQL